MTAGHWLADNNGKKESFKVHICTTFKWIELESFGCSGFKFATKPDQPGLFGLICLKVIKDKI